MVEHKRPPKVQGKKTHVKPVVFESVQELLKVQGIVRLEHTSESSSQKDTIEIDGLGEVFLGIRHLEDDINIFKQGIKTLNLNH